MSPMGKMSAGIPPLLSSHNVFNISRNREKRLASIKNGIQHICFSGMKSNESKCFLFSAFSSYLHIKRQVSISGVGYFHSNTAIF